MRIRAIRPYSGPVEADGLVAVFDLTVEPYHNYVVAPGIVVSNSKRISLLDVNALMSHGATETLRDAAAVRGQRNEQYWLQFMQGHSPAATKVPLVYEKFVNELRSAGIQVVREGTKTHIMGMTNQDVKRLTEGRVIRTGDTVEFGEELKPVPGGLFDPQLTGGHGGRQWAAIELPEPMPNPVMEEPIRRLLGLTSKDFTAVLSGEKPYRDFGSGPKAIQKALESINIDRELELAREQVRTGKGATRDDAVRRLAYLKSAQKLNVHPKEWMLDRVPVLPPAFRPVGIMGATGTPLVTDPNYLYKELIDSAKNFSSMRKQVDESALGPERLAVYESFKAVTGLADPVHPKLRERNVQGILKNIFGDSPKFGSVQRKLISTTVDNVGRAAITPNPDYDMDTIGIPVDSAFQIYTKFIARRLRRRGMPLTEALRHIEEQTPLAKEMLLQEMEERPIISNRAPVLFKFGIMAFRPKLVSGNTLQVSPLVLKGYNADFDGDAMQFHVPTLPEAVQEAYDRLLPSKNLFATSDFKTPAHGPIEEDLLAGLYHASRAKGKSEKPRQHVFRSKEDAIRAWKEGRISVRDEVKILET